jgi:predicted P-loop ATPase
MAKRYAGPIKIDLEPDLDTAVRFLATWFANQWHGEIEIGAKNPETGKITTFKRFNFDEIEQAAEYGIEANRTPGTCVYFRPCLIQPGSPRFVKDEHYLRSPGIWSDHDTEESVKHLEDVTPRCQPTMVCITGRHPHTRVHTYRLLSDGVGGAEMQKRLNTAVCDHTMGDSAVTNPTSLMRLPGSIAWPWKDGRIPELTEAQISSDPKRYYNEMSILHAFPPKESVKLTTRDEGELNAYVAFGDTADCEPLDVDAALAAMAIGNVHNTHVCVSAALMRRGEDRAVIFKRLINRTREITPKPLAANFEREMTRRIDVIIDSAMQFAPEKVAKRRVEEQVEELGDWAKELKRDRKGEAVKSTANVVLLMAKHKDVSKFLAFNEFTQAIDVMKPTPWRHDLPSEYPREIRDADIHEFRVWVEQTMGWVNIDDKHIKAAIQMSADRLRYHPVRDWLHHCHRVWKAGVEANGGRPRVSQFFSHYWGADDTPLNTAISRAFLISCVARGIKPGSKVDTMVVAEGDQGVGKSSGFRALVPPSERWFSDSHINLTASQKELGEMLAGVWIQELSELASVKGNKDKERLKGALTQQDDRFRPAYGLVARTVLRTTVFAGTHNPDSRGWLMDETGNRRFVPIAVRQVDVAGIAADRELIWGEAVDAYLKHEQWWITDDVLTDALNVEREDRMVVDDHLQHYIRSYTTHIPYFDPDTRIIEPPDKWPERNPRLDVVVATDAIKEIWGQRAVENSRFIGSVKRALEQLGWKETKRYIDPTTNETRRAFKRPNETGEGKKGTGGDTLNAYWDKVANNNPPGAKRTPMFPVDDGTG